MFLLADNQDITRAGLHYLCQQLQDEAVDIFDKATLLQQLTAAPSSVVVVDYTLFDINDADELEILHQRFPLASWVIFSVDLTPDFVRRVIAISPRFCVLLKESPLGEIRQGLEYARQGHRFICQHMTEQLLAPQKPSGASSQYDEDIRLTKTETEILKDIALGHTSREIAERRFSSFHTVNTHRKNIFRKLGVNTVHEATRYALRAGLVDAAEYYI